MMTIGKPFTMNFKVRLEEYIEKTLDVLFPVRMGLRQSTPLDKRFLKGYLLHILDNNLEQTDIKNEEVAQSFIDFMSDLKVLLDKDIEAIYNGDPAAKSKNEIIIAYPGFHATACYRIANYLLLKGVALVPRMITEYAHSKTGIDIHPAASIGEYLCIDHGTGVVIGETAIIGDHVKIYQGVTLGALSVTERNVTGQRHPTIGNNVVIYAQAIILGGETVIGDHSVIGGNVWLTESVPPHSKIYYKQRDTRKQLEI